MIDRFFYPRQVRKSAKSASPSLPKYSAISEEIYEIVVPVYGLTLAHRPTPTFDLIDFSVRTTKVGQFLNFDLCDIFEENGAKIIFRYESLFCQ
jgi:hypothetical protein